MNTITKKLIKIPKRSKSAKKGDAGRVLIIGGSRDYVGAVALAGLAALRSGVDWVTIAAPEKVAYSINSLSADLVTYKLKGDYFSVKHIKMIEKLLLKHNTVLIGNGISLKSKEFVKKIIKKINKPLVIDADAIKALSANDLKNSIITPHLGEFQLFLKNSNIDKKIINLISNINDKKYFLKNYEKIIELLSDEKLFFNKNSLNIIKNKKTLYKLLKNKKIKRILNKNYKKLFNKSINNIEVFLLETKALLIQKTLTNFFHNNNIILLKGPIDMIISKNKVLFNKTGNPGMAKAGTGDVLAGLAVGFLAQTNNLLQSAINAAYFNGLIGDILLKKHKGYTYLASDIVKIDIPSMFRMPKNRKVF